MPGVDLDLDLPSLSDTLSDVVTKTAVALASIQDDLAGMIVPSEIDINAALSLAGNSLTDASSVQFLAGNPPTSAGSLYYYSDGEFYVITANGTVKVTANGSLNIAAGGGFTGDYGLGDESASYDSASQEYRFNAAVGTPADLVCDDVVLTGTLATVRLSCSDSLSTARQIVVTSLPSSGISLLAYDASDSGLKDNNATRATNTVKVTGLDMTGEVTHTDRTFNIPFNWLPATGGGFGLIGSGSPPYWTNTGGTGTNTTAYFNLPLVTGQRLKSLGLVSNDINDITRSVTLTVQKMTRFPPAATNYAINNTITTSGGYGDRTYTASSPSALASSEYYQVTMSLTWGSGATAPRAYSLLVTYDKTA